MSIVFMGIYLVDLQLKVFIVVIEGKKQMQFIFNANRGYFMGWNRLVGWKVPL